MHGLLDADIIAYRVAAASENDDIALAKSRCTELVTNVVYFEANCDTFDGFLTGSNNFRKEIATIKPYKGNRTQPKPKHLEALREHLVKMGCKVVDGQEADDAIGIAAYAADPDSYTIISIDKDLLMLRGKHYNFVKKEFTYVTEEQAIHSFYTQLLTGDRTDNIPGIPGIGPAKAAKALKGITGAEEAYKAVKQMYANEGIEHQLLENARLLWIRRKEGEVWEPPKLKT